MTQPDDDFVGPYNGSQGYWESDPIPNTEFTVDKVIKAIFDSGAPGDSYFFTQTNRETNPWEVTIVIAWGEGWYIASSDEDDEVYVINPDGDDD